MSVYLCVDTVVLSLWSIDPQKHTSGHHRKVYIYNTMTLVNDALSTQKSWKAIIDITPEYSNRKQLLMLSIQWGKGIYWHVRELPWVPWGQNRRSKCVKAMKPTKLFRIKGFRVASMEMCNLRYDVISNITIQEMFHSYKNVVCMCYY